MLLFVFKITSLHYACNLILIIIVTITCFKLFSFCYRFCIVYYFWWFLFGSVPIDFGTRNRGNLPSILLMSKLLKIKLLLKP